MELSKLENHPISKVEWVDVDKLTSNDYNPNVVQKREIELLEHSILTNGWIQPILATRDYVIIDGFHRTTIAKGSKKIRELTGGKVPVCVMDISEADRKMLTIRINRAKGTHVAFKMADIVQDLIDNHGLSEEDVMQGIGADTHEIDILTKDDVFKKFDIPNHKYSMAWYPKPK